MGDERRGGYILEGDVASPADVMPLVRMFEEAEQSTSSARKLSEQDRDYYDGKQLSEDEKKALKKRGQPPVVYNRIQRKIDYLSGLEKQQRKDPKAFPRTPKDEGAADAATDAIRYVCDDEDWDGKRSQAWDDLLIPGTCAIMVGHKNGKMGPDPALFQIPWDRFFYDPHSARADFSDARYMGIVTWYDLEDAASRWDKRDILESTMASEVDSDTYDDKPKLHMWGDAKRRRVRVVELYYLKGGKWTRCVFTKAGHLEEPALSPYLDEDQQPENPIKAMSLYVDRDNNRYGAVRVMISPQDEINKRRSKGLHLITMRQARVGLSAVEDKEKIRRELAKPDGIISGDKDDFEILPTADMARGNFEMLQEAKNEIDLLGANAALAGKNENDLSGRAILAQQQGGMVEVARMFDRLRALSISVYRSIWNRIRQMWKNEKWIRITDDENNLRFVGLNQQVTVAMLAQEVTEGDQDAMQKAAKLVGPQVLQAAMSGDQQAQTVVGMFVQQNGQQIVEIRNAVNELDVDIVIDEGMDTPSVQAEQFDTIVKMIPALGPVAQSPQFVKVMIEASQLRNKDKLVQMLEEGPTPEQQQMQQQQQQLAEAGAVAQIKETESKTVLNEAKAQQAAAPAEPQSVDPIDAARLHLDGAQTQIDGYRAETERMEALKPEPPQQKAA
jgi:hypothetical protein